MAIEKGSLLQQRYRIEEIISKGGMGAVYRAFDETLGIAVALKENFFTNEESTRQFRREATILAGLRHPNLPRVTDHFVIPGQGQYLVMDFIEGADLRDFINQRGTLKEEEVIRVGLVICDALAYLHNRNPAIVHRDIKPGNIKITPAGQAYLVDFGLAKLAQGEATAVGAQALTPGYAPPEQYGQGTEPRSDIYALGATLFAALTGKLPEDGLSRVMGSATLTPIRTHNPKVSPAVALLVERAMAVQLTERYQSAETFKQALLEAEAARRSSLSQEAAAPEEASPIQAAAQAAASTGPRPVEQTSVRPEATPEALHANDPPTRRKKIPTAVYLGTGAVVVMIFLGVFLMQQPRQPAASVVAVIQVTPTAQATEPPASSPTDTVAPPTATAEPSRTPEPTQTAAPLPTATPTTAATPLGGSSGQIAFASNRSGTVQIWVSDSDGANARQVTRLPDGACQPAWSPDGLRLVFISPCSEKKDEYPRASLYIINADGAGLVPLKSVPGGDFDPAWSPDGSQIAFTSLRDNNIPRLYLYNLSDNTSDPISAGANRERHPAWSPDGKFIAHQTTRQGKPQIWLYNVETGRPVEFSQLAGAFDSHPGWSPDSSVIVFSQASPSMLVARQVGSSSVTSQVTLSTTVRPADNVSFSPDGWWLAFDTRKDGVFVIQRMPANGGSPIQITDETSSSFDPAWKP